MAPTRCRADRSTGCRSASYYGNDATQATNYPIVRLESNITSDIYYCRTAEFSTLGLQTGTVVHSCEFTVPSSVPLGSYCLRLIANGISTATCRNVVVARRRKWFKELKLEIKDKLEIIENLTEKRLPDIVDIKGIRENEIFERIEEEWVRTVRLVAETIDVANEELSRSFITPAERPRVGPPEPIVEDIVPRRRSRRRRRAGRRRSMSTSAATRWSSRSAPSGSTTRSTVASARPGERRRRPLPRRRRRRSARDPSRRRHHGDGRSDRRPRQPPRHGGDGPRAALARRRALLCGGSHPARLVLAVAARGRPGDVGDRRRRGSRRPGQRRVRAQGDCVRRGADRHPCRRP